MEQKNQMLIQIEARRDDFAGHHVNFYGKLKMNGNGFDMTRHTYTKVAFRWARGLATHIEKAQHIIGGYRIRVSSVSRSWLNINIHSSTLVHKGSLVFNMYLRVCTHLLLRS